MMLDALPAAKTMLADHVYDARWFRQARRALAAPAGALSQLEDGASTLQPLVSCQVVGAGI
jgi:hypothetical protein